MGQTVRCQEILCTLALIGAGCVADQTGLGLVELTEVEVLDPTPTLLHRRSRD